MIVNIIISMIDWTNIRISIVISITISMINWTSIVISMINWISIMTNISNRNTFLLSDTNNRLHHVLYNKLLVFVNLLHVVNLILIYQELLQIVLNLKDTIRVKFHSVVFYNHIPDNNHIKVMINMIGFIIMIMSMSMTRRNKRKIRRRLILMEYLWEIQ